MYCSPGATWTSTRSGFRSCTGASNAHVSALPKPCAMTSGFCLMLPMRTSRQPWPMSWAVATGTPGTSRPGPCGTGRPPPLGEPRQRHWHLACRTDTTAMTPGPRPSYSMGIGRVCRANPIRAWGIRACHAGPVTNSSGIRGSSSCRTTSRIERSVPGRRYYCSRSCCAAPTGRPVTNRLHRNGQPLADLPVGQAVPDQLQDLAFPRGQPGQPVVPIRLVPEPGHRLARRARIQQRPAGGGRPDRADQIGAADLLEHVAGRSRHDRIQQASSSLKAVNIGTLPPAPGSRSPVRPTPRHPATSRGHSRVSLHWTSS